MPYRVSSVRSHTLLERLTEARPIPQIYRMNFPKISNMLPYNIYWTEMRG
jgi:hypothetical protein